MVRALGNRGDERDEFRETSRVPDVMATLSQVNSTLLKGAETT